MKIKQNIILALGLQGAGKTTSCGKLAKLLKKKGHNPLLVPLDLKRPAAIEQLKILGEQVGVSVYGQSTPNPEHPIKKCIEKKDGLGLAKLSIDFCKRK